MFIVARGKICGVVQVCPGACVASLGLYSVCVRLLSSPVWVLICRPPVAVEHFTELHQRENRRTEEQRGRTERGRHQRPILPTVSTCCNIPVVTADKPLYKQPAQILPAGCTHSKAFCSLGFVYWSAAWTAGQHEGGIEVGRVKIERAQESGR